MGSYRAKVLEFSSIGTRAPSIRIELVYFIVTRDRAEFMEVFVELSTLAGWGLKDYEVTIPSLECIFNELQHVRGIILHYVAYVFSQFVGGNDYAIREPFNKDIVDTGIFFWFLCIWVNIEDTTELDSRFAISS